MFFSVSYSVPLVGLETAEYVDRTWIWTDGRTSISSVTTHVVKRLVGKKYYYPFDIKIKLSIEMF